MVFIFDAVLVFVLLLSLPPAPSTQRAALFSIKAEVWGLSHFGQNRVCIFK